MDNPYTAPSTSLEDQSYDVAGAAPYTVAQMRAAFMRFAIAYWGYMGVSVVFIGLIVFVAIKMIQESGGSNDPETIAASMASFYIVLGFGTFFMFAVAITLMVFAMILLYRYWKVMQPYSKRTTPGKAVGFMFIPLFNIYWMFVAYHGLSQDIDRYLAKHPDSNASSPNTSLVLATLIVMLASMIPYLGGFASLALIVLLFLTKLNLNNSIIGIIKDRSRQQAAAQSK